MVVLMMTNRLRCGKIDSATGKSGEYINHRRFEMHKFKFVSVFVSLALLLSATPVAVRAQEPLPPREPVPPSGLPEVSDMVVTESSGIELVTKQTEAGEVPVTVNRVEAVQTANIHGQIPRKDAMGTRGATSGSAGDVTVTMWRAIGYYYTDPLRPHRRSNAD